MREKRIAKLKQFLEQDPDDSFSRYALALEIAGTGEVEEAVALLEELLHRDPRYVPGYHQLGLLYERVGRREASITILERGIAVASEQGDTHGRKEMQEALDELQS